jgi:hypothetical protein
VGGGGCQEVPFGAIPEKNFITLGQPLIGEKYVARKRRKTIPKIMDTSLHCNA